MIDYIYYGLYKFFVLILSLFPKSWVIKLTYFMGNTLYKVSRKHQYIINANLQWAFGDTVNESEKKQIGIAAFTNLVDTMFGILKRDSMSKEDVLKNVTFEGEEIIQAYKDEGKQFILVTGHFGNWELLSQSIAIHFDLNLVGVGRKLDSKKMDEVLRSNRERFNVEMVYKNGAMKGCIKAIGQKKIVGILTDQSLSMEQSVDVRFFNHKTTHTPIASILSRKFGLDLIPAFISTEDYKNYRVKIYPPIKSIKTDDQEKDFSFLIQKQADILEHVIQEKPQQWFWMHKRWKAYNPELYQKGKK